jgi:hypothetical protein
MTTPRLKTTSVAWALSLIMSIYVGAALAQPSSERTTAIWVSSRYSIAQGTVNPKSTTYDTLSSQDSVIRRSQAKTPTLHLKVAFNCNVKYWSTHSASLQATRGVRGA